jgi:hypothetical protein
MSSSICYLSLLLNVHYYFLLLLIPWCKRIDDLLVHGPDLVPLHEDDGSGGTLSQDELLESFDGETSPENSSNRRKPGIVPTVDAAAVNEPGQLAFRHHLDANKEYVKQKP